MCWWNNALYDTCSLITLSLVLESQPAIRKHFSGVLTVEECLSSDNLRIDSKSRIERFVARIVDLPGPVDLSRILVKANLPSATAGVDALVYSAAVHHSYPVVTADKSLAKALAGLGLHGGTMAMVLRDLVENDLLSVDACRKLLQELSERNEFILPANVPPTWEQLRQYRFP